MAHQTGSNITTLTKKVEQMLLVIHVEVTPSFSHEIKRWPQTELVHQKPPFLHNKEDHIKPILFPSIQTRNHEVCRCPISSCIVRFPRGSLCCPKAHGASRLLAPQQLQNPTTIHNSSNNDAIHVGRKRRPRRHGSTCR